MLRIMLLVIWLISAVLLWFLPGPLGYTSVWWTVLSVICMCLCAGTLITGMFADKDPTEESDLIGGSPIEKE